MQFCNPKYVSSMLLNTREKVYIKQVYILNTSNDLIKTNFKELRMSEKEGGTGTGSVTGTGPAL
jgi:hypothetical protein